MPAHLMKRLRAALSLALIALSSAASAQDTATGVRYGVAPAQDCKVGSKAAAQGGWIEANGVAIEGPARRMKLSFNDRVTTDTMHVAMNKLGSRDLALVEIQDARGDWHKAWEGQLMQAAPGFDDVFCFEQQLPQKQVVQALRFTFRAAPGQVEVNHGALLRR
jgi:hypothetical protein